MALQDDARNQASGHVEEVSGELGDYSQIVISVTVEAATWTAIKQSDSEAAALVAWIDDNIQE